MHAGARKEKRLGREANAFYRRRFCGGGWVVTGGGEPVQRFFCVKTTAHGRHYTLAILNDR